MSRELSLEHIHKDIVKRTLSVHTADAHNRVQLFARASIKMSLFYTVDPQTGTSSADDVATDESARLVTMLHDAVSEKLFDAAPNAANRNTALVIPSTSSTIQYAFLGDVTQEVLVGAGDLNSAYFPALDMALLSMSKGETSLFAAKRRFGYSGDFGDLLFKVEVCEVLCEVDVLPYRQVTKHIVFRDQTPRVDVHGFSSPVYGANVECIVLEMHRFTEKSTARRNEKIEIGGANHSDWLDIALMSMQAGELATIRVAATGSVFKVRLERFANIAPPRTIDALLRTVDDLKSKGNDLFNQQHARCHARYDAALFWLRYSRPRFASDLDADTTKRLKELEVILEGNLSQTYLNCKNFEQAAIHARIAIDLEPMSFKNIFRKAKAMRGMRRFQDALMDLNSAQQVMEEQCVLPDSNDWKLIEEERTELEAQNI